jgi:hypothetical protein
MEKLLELIDNLLAYIMYGGEEELHKHKQLRKIWKDLRGKQLRYVDKKGRKLHTQLPARLLQLYRIVQTIQDLLPADSARSELLEDQQLLAYLINSRMPTSGNVDRSTFTYSRLRERIAPLENQAREWSTVEKELNSFLEQFNSEQFFGFNHSCFGLELLYSLISFDFESLLGQFTGSNGSQPMGLQPSFSMTPSEQVEKELLDLYFILAGLEVSPSLRTLAEEVLRYYRSDSESNIRVMRESLDQLELLLSNDLSEPVFRGLLQLIRQDPYYEPERMKSESDYLGEYAVALRERFNHNRERLQRELLHEQVAQKVQHMFGEDELLAPGGYNRRNDQLLADRNFSCFTHLHPLEIIKSYVHWKLKKGFLGSLKKIGEDGYFEDRNFRLHYEDAVKRAEGMIQDIDQFEQLIHGQGGLSVEDVLKMLERESLKAREAQTVQRFVEEANAQAKKLTEKATNILFALYKEVETVLTDFRSNNPKHVSNVRVIGGEKNSDIMTKIKDGHAELGELLDILRNYAVIYKEESKEQAGAE